MDEELGQVLLNHIAESEGKPLGPDEVRLFIIVPADPDSAQTVRELIPVIEAETGYKVYSFPQPLIGSPFSVAIDIGIGVVTDPTGSLVAGLVIGEIYSVVKNYVLKEGKHSEKRGKTHTIEIEGIDGSPPKKLRIRDGQIIDPSED